MEAGTKAEQLKNALRRLWRIALPAARWGVGWACLVIGVLGLVLPIIPGIPLLVAGVALVGRENIVVCWCEERWRQLLTLMLARTQPGTFAGSIVRRCHEWSAPRQGSERGVQNAEVIPARLTDDRE